MVEERAVTKSGLLSGNFVEGLRKIIKISVCRLKLEAGTFPIVMGCYPLGLTKT
jgi:hypothetical protein